MGLVGTEGAVAPPHMESIIMKLSHRSWGFTPLLLLAFFPGCDSKPLDPHALAPGSQLQNGAPLHATANGIPDRYVVVLKPGAAPAHAMASEVVSAFGGRVHHTYGAALNCFAATLPPQAVQALQRNPMVKYIAQDGEMFMTQTVQPDATWGLDRIDQRDLPLNTTYSYTADGEGVTVYVIDSGIRHAHEEFGGRASFGADWIGTDGEDCNGHGTHVAGTIAGTTYGVAKKADLVSVRVFACSGGTPTSTVIAAVDWVTANKTLPAVANMSLGGGFFAPMNEAVQNSIAAGVTYVVAAGNSNANACSSSPASVPEALTVGGTTAADQRISPSNAWFGSNFGPCVNIFAPGLYITSAWWSSNSAVETISGTSMSSPHVAGVAALYLQGNPTATPAQVFSAITSTASSGRVADPGTGSPNRLLFSGLTEEPPAPIIALNPSSLTFTFVTDPSGMSMSGGVPKDSADIPAFAAAWAGTLKTAPTSTPDVYGFATALSSTASAVVRLTNAGTGPLEWTASTNRSWIGVTPDEGLVAPSGMTTLTATVNASTLAAGPNTGTISITDPAASNSPGNVAVTANVLTGTRLQLGTPIPGLSGATGSMRYFMIDIPAGHFDLTFRISGGTGDADLYVRYGDAPSLSQWDCRPWAGGNNETCTVAVPRPGTYYVMLHAYSAYSGVTLETSVAPSTPVGPSDLLGVARSAGEVSLTWTDNSSNETSFAIQRSIRSKSSWSAFTSVGSAPANATGYTDTTVEAGATYMYRIRACNAQGCSAWATSAPVETPKGRGKAK
jgi:serine protease